MRNTIRAFLLLFIVSSASAQRIVFENPDLTFSFKKPKDWLVLDDGYVVKVVPQVADSNSTFFSITYFEDAKPTDGFSYLNSDENGHEEYDKKIAGKAATVSVLEEAGSIRKKYQFHKYSQRFEVTIQHAMPIKNPDTWSSLNRMIRTIRVVE